MSIKSSYNAWAEQYDLNKNKTRDLEKVALKKTLNKLQFKNCLEIGCGTGKNTTFLLTKSNHVTAVDFSENMLNKAKQKIKSSNVDFIQADILKAWKFSKRKYDLVTFSLVLEHIENLNAIFKKASNVLKSKGYVYIGELHPFKQYNGTKAKFETDNGTEVLTCFNHNISDFVYAAKQNGLKIENICEFFDNDNRTTIPRILTILFVKK